MHFVFVISLPILIVLFVVAIYLHKKLKRRLLKKEKDFCKSILLSESIFENSPKSSWNLVKLIMFKENVDKISDDVSIALIKKLRVINILYYLTFSIVSVVLLSAFLGFK